MAKKVMKKLLNQELHLKDTNDLLNVLQDQQVTVNIDEEEAKNLKFKDRLADRITSFVGSWSFIVAFSSFLLAWILCNLFLFSNVDPYPFILLNLLLSFLSALQAPIIMMSQNRQAERESKRNKSDFHVDLKSELLLEEIYKEMKSIKENQNYLLERAKKEKRFAKKKKRSIM